MTRVLFALFFCLVYTGTVAQSSHRQLFKIKGLSPAERIQIPGTNVHLVAPPDFQLSSAFAGLKNGSSLLEVYDLPGGSYRILSQDFTREKFEQQGLQVLSIDETTIDGYSARLISIQHNAQQGGLTAVFGDDTFSVIVVANFSAENSDQANAIRKAVLGIEYKSGQQNDPLFSAAFKLNDSRSRFHYDKRSANTFYYRQNNAEKDSYITVTQLSWDYTTSPSAIAQLMIGEMKKYGLDNADVRKKSSRKVNGYDAFESEMYATRKGEKCLVYQMVVVHEDHALVILGMGNDDFRKNRDEFRKLAHSVRFK